MTEDRDLPAFRWSLGEVSKTFRHITVNGRLPRPSGEQIKKNVERGNSFGCVAFEDGHVEVRWPEDPSKWSYYVHMDAALVAAELRGYHAEDS